jgi:hemolysin D
MLVSNRSQSPTQEPVHSFEKNTPALDPTLVPTTNPQWSNSLQNLLNQPAPTLPWKLMFGTLLFAGAFGAWAWFGQIDQVAVARGKLIPRTEARKVQPIDAGKVAQVNVREGDTVRSGQVLMELDTDLAQKDIERLQTALTAIRAELSQAHILVAQIQSQSKTGVRAAEADRRTKEVSVRRNESTIATQQQLLMQLKQDADRQQQRVIKFSNLASQGAISQEQVFGVQQALNDRKRTITDAEGTIHQLAIDNDRVLAEIAHQRIEAEQAQQQAQQQVQQQQLRVTELESKRQDTQVLLATAEAKRKQRFVYASESGKISSLLVKQPGEVVQPGQSLAEIAPAGQPLILLAYLPVQESGPVQVGMPVKVKLDAFAYQDYGIVEGRVVAVAADSQQPEQGGPVYRLEVSLQRHAAALNGQSIAFKAGQTGTAEIITRRKRIIDLLIDPIRKLRDI